MAGTPSRWPWRMGLLWLCLFLALLTWLPRPCRSIPCTDRTSLLEVSEDGRFAAVANVRGRNPESSYGDLATIDLWTGLRSEIPTDHSPALRGSVNKVLIRGSRLWVEGSTPSDIALYNLATSEEEAPWSWPGFGGLSNLVLSRDGKRAMILTSNAGPHLSVWDVDERRMLCSIDEVGTERCMSDDGSLVATYSREVRPDLRGYNDRWSVYDAETGELKGRKTDVLPPFEDRENSTPHRRDTQAWSRALLGERVTIRSHGLHFGDGDRVLLSGTTSGSSIWYWQTGLMTRDPRFTGAIAARQRFDNSIASNSAHSEFTTDGQWALVTTEERTLRDSILNLLSAWSPSLAAKSRFDGGLVRLWNVPEARVVATIPGVYDDIMMSDSGACVARLRDEELQVWSNPPRRPWVLSFCASLLVPAFWLLRRRRSPALSADVPDSKLHQTSSDAI